MNKKIRVKIFVDVCMATALLLLMAHSLIGEAAHEWIGAGMFVLVITHNLLNLNWYKNLFKGIYTPYRVFQLIIDLSIIFAIIGSMVSGIILSNHVFSFLPNRSGVAFARTLHLLSAYWGFTLMSFHVGLHTNMMIGAIRKSAGITTPSKIRIVVLRITAALFFAYGIYAFMHRQIGSYMLLLNEFVFFDFDEPLFFFFADYTAIMGMFIIAGHYISALFRNVSKRKSEATG